MRIGIIGPNKAFGLNKKETAKRFRNLDILAKSIAESGFKIVLTPDKNSLLAYFGEKYLEFGGKKIYEIVPLKDNYKEYLDTTLGEIISCEKWPNQPAKFNEECDTIFCVGYGGMVLAEIGFSRYYNPKTIYIINEFISSKLPKGIGLNIKYINIRNVKKILKKQQ